MPNLPTAPSQPLAPVSHGSHGSFHQIVKPPFGAGVPSGSVPVPVAPDLLGGTISVVYSEQIGAQGGLTPYSFAVTSGALPTGTSMSSSGLISGTPTATGTYDFTVTATDANGDTGSTGFQITIAAPSTGGGNYGYIA